MKIKKLSINYCCMDCGNQIWRETALYRGGRCKLCANKGNLNYNFIDGKKRHIVNGYDCLEKCGNKVCQEGRRCHKCNGKERFKETKNNPMYKKTLKEMHTINCLCSFCKAERGEYKGENHPNWLNGLSKQPYPLEFDEKLKEKIRKRDNYQCQNCNMTEEEHYIVHGCNLNVHHIDYVKTNCKEKNLITTCHGCNSRANVNRTYWQEFYNKIIIEVYI